MVTCLKLAAQGGLSVQRWMGGCSAGEGASQQLVPTHKGSGLKEEEPPLCVIQ